LINDILDLNKIIAGKLSLFIEEDIDLYPEIQTAVEMGEALVKDKPVVFVQEIDAGLPFVRGDRRRIRQVLINLVSNAAKFTDDGRITFTAKRFDDHILFGVCDTGPGVPAEMQAAIFEPFVQTEIGSKHAQGTGLGLPISKSLVEAHGGRIWVESEVGQGSAFYATLPLENNQG
jgi:signal transduction histidine kinase